MPKLSRPVRAFLLFLLVGALFKHRTEGDTIPVMKGAVNFLSCVREGASTCDVCYYPFFQTGVALLVALVGGAGVVIDYSPRVYALLSALSFLGIVAIGYRALARAGGLRTLARADEASAPTAGLLPATLFTLAMIQSPFLWYARSSFGELPSAFFLFAVTLQLADDRPTAGRGRYALLALTAFAACLTKEIYPPLIALWALFLLPWKTSAGRSRLFALLGGVAGGLAVNLSWNLYRFGTLSNRQLLEPKYIVPDLSQHLQFVFALLTSPNGGILLYWPLCMILLGLGVAGAWSSRESRPKAIGIMLIFSIVIVGIARWFAPMGWVSWGPRLVLPWLPALLWTGLRFAPESKLRFLQRGRGWAVLGLTALLSVPQAMIMFDRDSFNAFFAGPIAACPEGVSIDTNPAGHYACVNHLMGFAPEHWIWGNVWKSTLTNPGFAALALLYLAVLAHSIFRIARGPRDRAAA